MSHLRPLRTLVTVGLTDSGPKDCPSGVASSQSVAMSGFIWNPPLHVFPTTDLCCLSSGLVVRSQGHKSSFSKAGPCLPQAPRGASVMNHRSVLPWEPGWQGPIIYLTWNELDYLTRLKERSPLILRDSSWHLRILFWAHIADTPPPSPFLNPNGMPRAWLALLWWLDATTKHKTTLHAGRTQISLSLLVLLY